MTALPEAARVPSSHPTPPGTVLQDAHGPLLRIDQRGRAGLIWLKHRCRFWLTALKRRRKYGLPRGEPFTPEESELIGALVDLENAVSRLLTSSLCPLSETCPEHPRQGDPETSRPQSSHKMEANFDRIGKG